MDHSRFLMVAGLSRAGKTQLAAEVEKRGFKEVRGGRTREALCDAIPEWDPRDWPRRSGNQERDAQAELVIRDLINSSGSGHLVTTGEYLHEERNRGLLLDSLPEGFLAGFVMLDVSFNIYRTRFDEAKKREPRRLFSKNEFTTIREKVQWPTEAEGFRRTIYVRVGEVGNLPTWETPPIEFRAKDDAEFRREVFHELVEAVCQDWGQP